MVAVRVRFRAAPGRGLDQLRQEDLIAFGDGARLPRRFACDVIDSSLPYDVELDIEIRHDEPVCTALRAVGRPQSEPITGTGLRTLPVAELVRIACTATANMVHRWPLGVGKFVRQEPDEPTLIATVREARRTRGYRTLDDPFLKRVAKVWRDANPRSRTKAVADHWNVGRRTARGWVQLARDAGLIPEERT